MKAWQVIRTICRISVGLLFIFSGYVKAVDPQGFAIKLGEYFDSLHIAFLHPLALTLSILVIAAELLMGLCLIARLRMCVTAWAVLLFMLFFIVLTFFIAVNGDIVSDCGCFGDAIKLSNVATFLKNLVIMPFVLVIFIQRKKYKAVASPLVEWGLVAAFFIIACGIELYSNRHLPLIDFMAYKVGTNIPQAMSIPEGAPRDSTKIVLIYEKDGLTKEFDDQNYPWQDSTWRHVETKTVLLKKGYTPPIHDFNITSYEHGTVTDSILSYPGYTFILTSPKVEKAETGNMDKVNSIASYCAKQGQVTFFGLTSSLSDATYSFAQSTKADYPFCTADETVIKSMVRSNPGLMLIHNGTIVAKWSNADIPNVDKVKEVLSTSPEQLVRERISAEKTTNIIIVLALLCMAGAVNLLKRKTP